MEDAKECKFELSLLSRLILACVLDHEDKGEKLSISSIHRKICAELDKNCTYTLEEVTNEVIKLKYKGQLFVEYGSNLWGTQPVKSSVPH